MVRFISAEEVITSMNRKLVQQGTTTLMVSLPAKWVKQHNLGKGDEVDIRQTNGDVVISAAVGEAKRETGITLKGLNESLIRTLITNTYRMGFDRVEVRFESQKQYDIMKTVMKTRLVGFDIIKKGRNYCIVENITEPTEDQFENILGKIFFSISEFFDITRERLSGRKVDYEEISERIQKYDNFCRRVIAKQHTAKAELFWTFLALLVHAQRELYYLNKDCRFASDAVLALLADAKGLLEILRKSYVDKDFDSIALIHNEQTRLVKRLKDLMKRAASSDRIAIAHIISAVRRLYQAQSPLFGLMLE